MRSDIRAARRANTALNTKGTPVWKQGTPPGSSNHHSFRLSQRVAACRTILGRPCCDCGGNFKKFSQVAPLLAGQLA
jgi:hypothetical protein